MENNLYEQIGKAVVMMSLVVTAKVAIDKWADIRKLRKESTKKD